MGPNMHFYRAYGLNICSEIHIPEFPEGKSLADVIIKLGNVDLPLSNEIIINGRHFQVTNDSVYLFWNDVGKFKVSHGKEIIVDPTSNVDANTLNQFIVGSAMAVLLNQRGYLILHASAVNVDGYTIAFLGESGIGKSTIADALYLKGYPIITDDVLAAQTNKENKPLIIPSFPYLKLKFEISEYKQDGAKLNPNSEYSKHFNNKNNGFLEKSEKLDQIYILDTGDNLDISHLSQQEAIFNLLSNSYCIRLFKEEEQISNLKQCAEIINNVPVYQLKIPRSLDVLPEVIKLIENSIPVANLV